MQQQHSDTLQASQPAGEGIMAANMTHRCQTRYRGGFGSEVHDAGAHGGGYRNARLDSTELSMQRNACGRLADVEGKKAERMQVGPQGEALLEMVEAQKQHWILPYRLFPVVGRNIALFIKRS